MNNNPLQPRIPLRCIQATLAENNSPAILAAQGALDAASKEVSKQRAGHLPTLELVASRSQSSQGSGLIGGQTGFSNTVNSIGMQLNVPLYSGNEQNAKVAEALALRDKASHELEATRRATIIKIKQAWLMWKSSSARYKSGEQSISSGHKALKAAQAQQAYGIKTDLDVLQAQQQLDEALRDARKARNEAILGYIKLRSEAGQLTAHEVLDVEENHIQTIHKRYTFFSSTNRF